MSAFQSVSPAYQKQFLHGLQNGCRLWEINKTSVDIFGMSRNNVFKLSGNMALGSNEAYGNSDFDNIKSSLKLLKSKQTQRQQNIPPEPTNYYPSSYSSNAPSRNQNNAKNSQNAEYAPSYNYPPNPRQQQQQPASHKDVYYQKEQNYPTNDYKQQQNDYKQQSYQPTNDYKQKRNNPSDYEQPERNAYQKPSNKAQNPPPRAQQGGFEDKSIKEVNRQNRVEIKEYDPSELVECSEGCGRKFNPDSIAKHENVCRQVFQKKRKEFNAQDQRLVANEQKKLMKRGEAVERKLEEKKAKEKVPKWKADSLALRSGIKQNRGEEPTHEEKQILEQARNNDLTKCQFCGRSFNEQAAKKHIPFCEAQQKKNQMKRK